MVRSCWALAGLLFSLAACSGAASTDILEPTPSTSANTPAPGQTPAPATGSTTGPDSTKRGDDDKRSGEVRGDDDRPGRNVEPNTPACMVELEGNKSPEKATTFTSCIAGRVAASKDTDFVRIVAPAGARRMKVEHKESDGKVLYRVTEERSLIPLLDTAMFSEGEPEIRVSPGEGYLFRISSLWGGDQKNERPWEISVRFDD